MFIADSFTSCMLFIVSFLRSLLFLHLFTLFHALQSVLKYLFTLFPHEHGQEQREMDGRRKSLKRESPDLREGQGVRKKMLIRK